MTSPAPRSASPASAAWGRTVRWASPAAAWTRGITHSPRRAALAACSLLLLPVAIAQPLSNQDVLNSVQISVAFFATLLTGEAVIFALSFPPSSGWPSLREIDAHIAFREWVVAGWLAGMLAAAGLLTQTNIPGTYGALLFLLADVFGMFSFVRLFGLASADGRKRLLRRTLARALTAVSTPAAGLQQRMREDHVLNAYLGQLNEAAARSDGNGVRDLADQLATIPVTASDTAILALHLDVMHRLAKAALVGMLDPVVASGAAQDLLTSLLTRAASPGATSTSTPDARRAADAMAQASRYLAWLGSTSLTLSVQDVTPAGAARELVAFSVRARDQILRLADPDPPYAAGTADLGTPLTDTASVLAWISGFCEFHGSHQAAGLYPVYEILTGTKFLGNYWDGDSILTGLREALFAPGTADTTAAQATKGAFGNTAEFDRIWTLISAQMIATLRDVRRKHPPELVRPEFSADPQLLGAYLRTFASHRYFTTAGEALATGRCSASLPSSSLTPDGWPTTPTARTAPPRTWLPPCAWPGRPGTGCSAHGCWPP
jgi:hypothetical protein